jgi:predicted tellurium resistance membrane protein TerC
MEWLSSPDAWAALLTLTILEIVLGIDNIVFITILTGRLPEHQRKSAFQLGLGLALITRILLLLAIGWVMSLNEALVTLPMKGFKDAEGHTIFDPSLTGRDLVLLGGGLFLLYKAIKEIHHKLEGADDGGPKSGAKSAFAAVIAQILVVDLVFSLDSVITAVGIAKDIGVMITAVVISVIFMLIFALPVSRFVNRHPTVKMLALAFLVLIGVTLIAEGFGSHVEKGYIYFAMAFSVAVEALNLRAKGRSKPVELHGPKMPDDAASSS